MLREIIERKKALMYTAVPAAIAAITAVPAFAVDPVEPAVTSDMLAPLVDGFKANLSVIVPVGIGLFAIILAITFLPKIVKRFTS